MNRLAEQRLKPARILGPAAFLSIGCLILGFASNAAAHAPAAPAHDDSRMPADRSTAQAALTDIKAAIQAIVAAEDDSATGPASYKMRAQQAINALVGQDDDAYKPVATQSPASQSSGWKPADQAGAIGDINHLLDRAASPPWVPTLHGVTANIQAAVARLQEAQTAKGLMAYQIAISQSLISLEVAEGRRGEIGALGGMRGAIENTTLAVPGDAKLVDGCAAPKLAPAYGVHAGYLLYRTIPLQRGGQTGQPATWTIANPGGSTIAAHNGFLVFNLPESAMRHQLCAVAKSDTSSSSNEGSSHASE